MKHLNYLSVVTTIRNILRVIRSIGLLNIPPKKTPGKYQVLLRKLTSAVTQQSADDSVTTFATCRLTATVPSTIVTWSFTS